MHTLIKTLPEEDEIYKAQAKLVISEAIQIIQPKIDQEKYTDICNKLNQAEDPDCGNMSLDDQLESISVNISLFLKLVFSNKLEKKFTWRHAEICWKGWKFST